MQVNEKLEDLLYRLLDTKDSICLPIKWAWQRLTRGWDDRVIWSIDYYLSEMMPAWLRRLKRVQHGYPCQFEGKPEKWDEVLDTIIDGFEAAKQINDCDFPVWDWLREREVERYGRELDIFSLEDQAKMDVVKEEINFREVYEAQEAGAMERFHEGIALFVEHYFSLWD